MRSNAAGRVGFLQDWRRLNVAITRAKRGLVIVGDSQTLSSDENWRALVDWCRNEGVFQEADVSKYDRLLDSGDRSARRTRRSGGPIKAA